MKAVPLCDPYMWENPKVLGSTSLREIFPPADACVSEMVNNILWAFIVFFSFGVVGVATTGWTPWLAVSLGLSTAWSVPTILRLAAVRQQREGFQAATATASSKKEEDVIDVAPLYDVIGTGAGANALLTLPTARNPFMNVLVDEIKYNPTRPMAASIMDPSVKVGLDDFFRAGFYSDPTDVFGKTQSQRQFITMPSTSIPNDQGSYQDWLYKIQGKTCKEGGREACLPGTDGGPLPWLNANI